MLSRHYKHHRLESSAEDVPHNSHELYPVTHTIKRKPLPIATATAVESRQKTIRNPVTSTIKRGLHAGNSSTQEIFWRPIFHYRRIVYSFVTTFFIFLVLLVVLQQYSKHFNGIATVDAKDYYLWTFGPTAVLTIINSLWGQVEYRTLQLLPWRLMSRGMVPASDSILLDYVSMWNVHALFRSVKRRHYMVTIVVAASLLLKLTTAFSTGLFTTAFIISEYQTNLVLASQFSGVGFNQSEVDARSYMRNWSSRRQSGNDPLGTFENHAYQSFYPDTYDTDHTPTFLANQSYTAVVNALTPDLDCDDATVVTSNTSSVVQLQCGACALQWLNNTNEFLPVKVNLGSCDGLYSEVGDTLTGSSVDAGIDVKNIDWRLWVFIAQEVADGQGLPVATAEAEDGVMYFDFVALMCTPRYNTTQSTVTLTGTTNSRQPSTTMALGESVVIPELANVTASSLLYAAYLSVNIASSDSYIARGPEYLLLGIDIATISTIFSPTGLRQRVTDSINSLSVQVANQYLTKQVNDLVNGTVTMPETRLMPRTLSVVIICSLLGCLILLATGFALTYLPYAVCPRDPISIGGLATILARSSQMMKMLSDTGPSTKQDLKKMLLHQRYSTNYHGGTFVIEQERRESVYINKFYRGTSLSWWRPVSTSLWARIPVFLLPTIIIIALEALYRRSIHSGGIFDSLTTNFVNSLIVYIPALILLGVRTLYELIYFTARIFQPFHNLQKGNGHPTMTIMDNQHRHVAIIGIWRALMKRQWPVMAAGIAVLLGPFLPVVVSGLYTSSLTVLEHDITLTQLNRLNMSDGYFYIKSQTYEYAWLGDLILEFNSSYPQWTYEQLSFPKIQVVPEDLTAYGYTSNDSLAELYVTALEPAVYIDMGCTQTSDSNFHAAMIKPPRTRSKVQANDSEQVVSVNLTSFGNIQASACNLTSVEITVSDLSSSSYFNGWAVPEVSFDACTDGDGATELDDPKCMASSLPTECPAVLTVYGQISPDATQIDNIVVLQCRPRVEQANFEVRYSMPSYSLNSTVPPSKIENSTVVLWDGYMSSGEMILPPPDELDRYFVSMDVGDTSTAALDPMYRSIIYGLDPVSAEDLLNSTVLINSLNRNMGILTAQLINWVGREDYPTNNGTALAALPTLKATLGWPFRRRVVQNKVPTRALQAILAVMCICGATSILLMDTRAVLPKNPLSIAATASLLADSRMLQTRCVGGHDHRNCGCDITIPPGSEWCDDKELRRRGVFHGKTFAMGWWDGAGNRVKYRRPSDKKIAKGKYRLLKSKLSRAGYEMTDARDGTADTVEEDGLVRGAGVEKRFAIDIDSNVN